MKENVTGFSCRLGGGSVCVWGGGGEKITIIMTVIICNTQ